MDSGCAFFLQSEPPRFRGIVCGAQEKKKNQGLLQSVLFCFFPFTTIKNGWTFGWDSVRKSLIRVGPRENGSKGMALASGQLRQRVLL